MTGCAAGQHAQTVAQTPSIDGVQAQAGNIAIRAAGIAAPSSGASYAKGSDAPLRMVLINQGITPDKLVSVSSPAAGNVQISAGSSSSASGSSPSASASESSSVSASPSASGSATGSPSASGSATGSPSASGSASATGSSSGSQSTPIELGGRQAVQIGIGSGGPTVTLTGLTTELFPSQPVPVTFTFASGASVTVTMAVQLTSEVPSAPPTVSEATELGGE